MNGQILLADGSTVGATTASARAALSSGNPFWLDLVGLDDEAVSLLTDAFQIHPLAIEDAVKFGQRPKLESYENFVHLVVFGAEEKDFDTIEVHAFYSASFLVTIRRGPIPALDVARSHAAVVRRHGQASGIYLLYTVMDALVDSYFPVLEHFDDAIDDLEEQILLDPTDAQLGRLFQMKRSIVALRKVVTPERDVLAGITAGALDLPGMTTEVSRYFRDVYDHVIRVSDLVDSYRDLVSSAVDTHLSVVSNRLNVVMKQLTIIATVFLPLTFLTGFFGQNFSTLVGHISGLPVFLGAGIGLEVVAVALLFVLFRRRRWL